MSAEQVERLARVIRDRVAIGPIGPNSWEILTRGGKVALTSTEAEEIAAAILASNWLASLLDEARAEGRREALGEAVEAIRRLRADAAMPSPLSYDIARSDAACVVAALGEEER